MSDSKRRPTGTRASRQLPLALRYPPDQRFETFVAAPAGALAQLSALTAAGNRLLVTGAASTGKTHLLLAACAQAEATGHRAAYLPLATAAGRLRDALDAMDGYDLLALDGLEAIAGGDDEVALFDAHNRTSDARRALLYAARGTPDSLSLALPDLRSRLAQCTQIALRPLDDAGRREVLHLRAQRRGLQLEDAAIDWLLRHANRDLANLTRLLDQLDRASLAAQRRITLPFLRQVLGEP